MITGFGPFLSVADNPSARLVRALDGVRAGPWRVVGRVLEVSYAGGPAEALRQAELVGAALIVGFGVSRTGGLRVERTGRARLGTTPDVRGERPARLEGPDEVRATADAAALATALACRVSDDAGAYVCNAWLHQVAWRSAVPAVFVHIPPEGVSPQRVRDALAALAT
ncbi:MAG: hypothetical protein EP330_30090 [Deltaproteobacteria bacterium]|nr:MAG: hypothetical protein EP330_30090 [Deltaproteobacteria bacterium]